MPWRKIKQNRINSVDKESFTEKMVGKKMEYFKICLFKIASKHDNAFSTALKVLKRGIYSDSQMKV